MHVSETMVSGMAVMNGREKDTWNISCNGIHKSNHRILAVDRILAVERNRNDMVGIRKHLRPGATRVEHQACGFEGARVGGVGVKP